MYVIPVALITLAAAVFIIGRGIEFTNKFERRRSRIIAGLAFGIVAAMPIGFVVVMIALDVYESSRACTATTPMYVSCTRASR